MPRDLRARLSSIATSLCCVAGLAGIAGGAQDAPRRPAQPVEPISAIVDAFQSYSIVALGEGAHGNLQGMAFRLALIRDPRFLARVDDIVVESGSARYQDVIDRYVRGEDVPASALRDVREQSVGATPAWDRPMYAEFFTAVRDVNLAARGGRQLRVLLGDPPIDWNAVTSTDEYRTWLLQRDAHPADVVRREVLATGRRALLIYGDGHFQARSERPGRSLLGVLETGGARVFNITSTFAALEQFQPDVMSWRVPALASLKGTHVGATPYEVLFGPPPPTDYFRANPRIEDHFDAVLYLGPASSRTTGHYDYPRCAEPDYVRMRVTHMVLSGLPPTVADRLAAECAAAATAAAPAR
jgi:hypothetical protein